MSRLLMTLPNMIQKRAKQLRRTFFNRAPTLEPIDYSRYLEEECHFVKKSYRAELDRIMESISGPRES